MSTGLIMMNMAMVSLLAVTIWLWALAMMWEVEEVSQSIVVIRVGPAIGVR